MDALYQLLAFVAVILFVGGVIQTGLRPVGTWLVPAAISLLFLVWSVYTVASEGPLGFWPIHTQNAWGNQVWFDLLIAIGLAWALILPRARAVGMRPWPWLGLILCTGCIGLAAMFARCRYLETRRPA